MGATLAGGHTIEGPQFTVGFTILASQDETIRTKGALREGDRLILTKPLGTGVLLAAHMQARLQAQWFVPLLSAMLRSNQPAAELLEQYNIQAATDVTGFGLTGHLLEMLRGDELAVEMDLHAVPLLPGAAELLREGLESTLAPDNRGAEAELEVSEMLRNSPAYAALFDPQTCGGLLIAVRPERAEDLVRALSAGGDMGAVVGTVVQRKEGRRIRCF